MLTTQLQIEFRKESLAWKNIITSIIVELQRIDSEARLVEIEKALASRDLIKQLWSYLPEESLAKQFKDLEAQTIQGKVWLPRQVENEVVILHLGWDVLCFQCSLISAWETWTKYCRLHSSNTYNACIYPTNLQWYIVRAGTNLYPMIFEDGKYKIKG
jgi:hypothetical protein